MFRCEMLSFQAHEHIINTRGACVIPCHTEIYWASSLNLGIIEESTLWGWRYGLSIKQTNGFLFMFYSSGVANSRETYHKAREEIHKNHFTCFWIEKQTDSQKGRDLDYECGTISQTKQSISTLMKHVVVLNLSSHWRNLSQIQSNKHI